MDGVLQDVRFCVRGIVRRPGLWLVAVASLALGIGANTAVFSLIDGMFLRPLSVHDPDSLVLVHHQALEGQGRSAAYADYVDLRDQSTVFSGLVAESRRGGLLKIRGEARLVLVSVVSDDYFSMLGLEAKHGRLLAPDLDAGLGAPPGVILGYGLWARRFGRDPDIVGETVELSEHSLPVIGVMPASFRGFRRQLSIDLWVSPATWVLLSGGNTDELDRRDERVFRLLGRLAPGVTLAQANTQLTTIADRLAQAYPETNTGRSFRAELEAADRTRTGWRLGFLLLSVVGLVLLIACANVANLLLADAEARRHETALRLALGADRQRLIRQFLTEALVLACLGMIAGLAVAFVLISLVPALSPPGPIVLSPDLRLDARVLAITALSALGTVVLFGLVPALRSSRREIVSGLKGEEIRVGGGRFAIPLRSLLVVSQMAICVALIATMGMTLRSFLTAQAISPGFDVDKPILVAWVSPDRPEQVPELAAEIEALAGIRNVTWARRLVLSSSGGGASREVSLPGQDPVSVKYNQVAPNYFEVMGTRILRGRLFDDGDRQGAAPVVMINATMAARFWPGEEPIASHMLVGDREHEIVAIVEDGKINSLHESAEPFLYLPYAQAPSGDLTLLIETERQPSLAAGAVRRALLDDATGLSLLGLRTLKEHMRAALYADRVPLQIGTALGLAGVLLAAVGLFGVVSRMVNERRRELGIRVALGADRGSLRRLVLGHGLRLSLAGVVVGLGLALLLGRVIASSLHGVNPADPLTLGASCLLVVLVAMVTSHLPARVATSIEPMEVLRE